MTINWGWKIAITYLLFVAGMLWLVVKANQQQLDLVATDYYAQGMQYQQRIDARSYSSALASRLGFEWLNTSRQLNVHWPDGIEKDRKSVV